MAKDHSPDPAEGTAEFRARFADLVSGLDLQDLQELGRRLMAAGPLADLAGLPVGPPPSRRRPRRADDVTYRVRVDVKGAKPPIWRRLELSSQMPLDELHQVIQTAFGWSDSHLHRFASGPSVWDRTAEVYLCPFDVDEGEDEHGIPEHEVRLDEVLVDVGESLHYVYDYGDGWEHVVRLEAVLDRPAAAARARCTDGRRDAPPEDCGGIGGYEELLEAGEIDDEDLDLEGVNASLSVALELAGTVAASGAAGALLRQLKGHLVELEVVQLVREARLDEPVLVDLAEATRMVGRYAWLLERVGDTGIRLTAAGYLPPRDVEAAWTELEMSDEWFGRGNREVQTLPVLELRESAQRMGLLRKNRGDLLLTKAGRTQLRDPVGLWWHVASRLAAGSDESFEAHAGLVALLGVAAGRDIRSDAFERLINEVLTALGWRTAGGAPLSAWSGAGGASGTVHTLRQMGAFTERELLARQEVPTPGGRALARAVLRGRR